jgi:TolB protein
VWSPDGSSIAFASNRDEKWEIYVMNADGTEPRRLTDISGDNVAPSWSPDGDFIVFARYTDTNWKLYRMNADGTDLLDLTKIHPFADELPTWYPW